MTAPLRRLALLAAVLAAGIASAPALAAPPIRHAIDLTFDPASGRLTATDRVHLNGGGAAAFALADGLEIRSVTVDGRAAEPRRTGGRWQVPLGAGGPHDVAVRYGGRPGAIGAADGLATAGPDGAFLPGGLPWFPRFAESAFDFRLTLRLPMPMRGLTTGRLVDEKTVGDRRVAVFENDGPADALPLFAGPYGVRELVHHGLRLRTYFHAELAPLAADYLHDAAAYIDGYVKRIGPYPFAGFSIVSAPLPVGLGYPGLTYIGRRVLALPFIRTSSLPHEILHNWWGNGVYVDYASGNWCEGLTTFMADYALVERRGAAAARAKRLEWLRNFAALPAGRDRPAVDFVARKHDAAQVVGYDKVAFFFHMLRDDIGGDAFNAGVRRLWADFRFKTAAWPDLRHEFEAASGRDLKGFFDQWLRRPGAPALHLENPRSAKTDHGYRVDFTLRQPAPTYALRVPVDIETAQGIRHFSVDFDSGAKDFSVETDARPLSLAVDPDFDLFRRLAPDEAPPIIRDVTLKAGTAVAIAAKGAAAATARRLAAAMLDLPSHDVIRADSLATPEAVPDKPLLIIGVGDALARVLHDAALGKVPENLAGRGTARAWVFRRRTARGEMPVLVVMADDDRALAALMRPLPHYGRRGYVLFDGGHAIDRGNWPAGPSPLTVRFDGRKAKRG